MPMNTITPTSRHPIRYWSSWQKRDGLPQTMSWWTMAAVKGGAKLTGTRRLRIKESDRLSAITCELNKLGARIEEYDESITVYGKTELHGGVVDSHNDHRIAMSMAIAATVATGDVIVNGADSVRKSYADFWDDYSSLGGETGNGE